MSVRCKLPIWWRIIFNFLVIGLQFGSFVPLWFFAQALAHLLGIPDHAPVKEQPFGLLWLILVFIAMPILQLGCVVSGFLLSALILRFGLGWSWAMIRDASVCPQSLIGWLEARVAVPIESKSWDFPHNNPMYDPQLDPQPQRSTRNSSEP
jgi:hypothetical protein